LEKIDPTTIPLPSWAKPELLTSEDKAEMEACRATLPKFDSSALSLRAKGRVAGRDAFVRLWAAKRTSPERPKLKADYQAHFAQASTALKAKGEAKAVTGNRTPPQVSVVQVAQDPTVQSDSVPATKAA
jgi:hypothetical protein